MRKFFDHISSRRVKVHEIYESEIGDGKLVEVKLTEIGFALVIIGLILAFLAVIFLAAKSKGNTSHTRGGGVLLIGPIPIIFGTDRESVKILVVLAIVLIIIVLASMFIPLLVMR